MGGTGTNQSTEFFYFKFLSLKISVWIGKISVLIWIGTQHNACFELNDNPFSELSCFTQFRIFCFLSCFSRFGSFEILAVNGELAELKQLADFVLEVNFPHLFARHADSREVRHQKFFVKKHKKMTVVCSILQKSAEKSFGYIVFCQFKIFRGLVRLNSF